MMWLADGLVQVGLVVAVAWRASLFYCLEMGGELPAEVCPYVINKTFKAHFWQLRARKQLSDDVEDAYWNWIYTLNDIRSGNNGWYMHPNIRQTVAFYDKTVEDPRSFFELFHPHGLDMFSSWRYLESYYIAQGKKWQEETTSLDLAPPIESFAVAQWTTDLIVPERITTDIIVWTPPQTCLPEHYPRPPKPKTTTMLDGALHHGTFSTRPWPIAWHTLALGFILSGFFRLATLPAVGCALRKNATGILSPKAVLRFFWNALYVSMLLLTALIGVSLDAEFLYAAGTVFGALRTGSSRRNHGLARFVHTHGPSSRPRVHAYAWPNRKHRPSRARRIVSIPSVPEDLFVIRPMTRTNARVEATVAEARHAPGAP